MNIKKAGDPIVFEYWCFGLRVSLRFLLVLLLSVIILNPAWIAFLLFRDWLQQFMEGNLATLAVIILGIVVLPFAFVGIALCSRQFGDTVMRVTKGDDVDSDLEE